MTPSIFRSHLLHPCVIKLHRDRNNSGSRFSPVVALVCSVSLLTVSTSLAQSSSTLGFPIDTDNMAIIEKTQRAPALRTPTALAPDGKQVRLLLAPDDLSYSNLIATVASYLNGDVPQQTTMQFADWTAIFGHDPALDDTLTHFESTLATPTQPVSLDVYSKMVSSALNEAAAFDAQQPYRNLVLNIGNQRVLNAIKRIMGPMPRGLTPAQRTARQSAAFSLTPLAVIGGLNLLQDLINDALNRADEIATSQLFAMREHIAASIADMDVLFRDRLNETFDRLNEQERVTINAAVALTNQTNVAIQKLENETYLAAADDLCQAAVAAANFNILPLFEHKPAPDIMCLTTPEVRDIGTLHERFLTFRGVSLRRGGDYPDVTLTVPTAQKSFHLPAGGGDTILQIPLPGGINGGPGDLTPRGSLIAVTDFDWSHASGRAKLMARWLFLLDPYLVSSLDVSITPKIRQASYKPRYQDFYLEAEQGGTNTETWSIIAESGTKIVACSYYVNTKVGKSEVKNLVNSPGACQVEAIARGGGFLGGGGSIGIRMSVTQQSQADIAGPTWQETKRVVNQSQSQAVFTYDIPAPPDSTIIDYNYNWRVVIQRNTEEVFILTDSNQSDSKVGAATMNNMGVLTVTLNPPMNP